VLVRLDEATFIAFSQECTHLSCSVVPEPETKCFRCPCHEGSFEISTGRPIAGPPRRPACAREARVQTGPCLRERR
jgi:Rieske Fe-S protein